MKKFENYYQLDRTFRCDKLVSTRFLASLIQVLKKKKLLTSELKSTLYRKLDDHYWMAVLNGHFSRNFLKEILDDTQEVIKLKNELDRIKKKIKEKID